MKFIKNKGITMLELLIVIAILAILTAVVMAVLNPVKKINLANDTNIKSNVSSIATAVSVYATNGYYPGTVAELIAAGDLGVWPTGPSTVTYLYKVIPAGCTAALKSCTAVSVNSSKLFLPKVAGNVWCWRSATGVATEVASAAVCIP